MNKPVEATSEVVSIDDTEEPIDTKEAIYTEDSSPINSIGATESTEIEVVKEVEIASVEKEEKVDAVRHERKEEKPKNMSSINKKSSGFFSSFFKSKPKVKNQYYTGGKIRSKLVMSDDTGESGLLYRYGYEGQITSTVNIKNGIKNGLETLFNKKGQVMKRTPYVNGKKNGIVEVYYADGKVLAQITYVNDKRHGRASKYNHDATTNEEVEYNYGRLITEQNDINIPMID
jgi:antitoxin component YwqK of YwqJK toxin-antitoxin module